MKPLQVVGAAEAAAMAGIHPSTFAQYLRRGQNGVPTPDATLACGPVWRTSTIQRWVDGRTPAQQRGNI